MSPIHPDKYPPVIENSDQDLKDMCFQKAHEMYGEVLPKIVEDRLEQRAEFHYFQWICGDVYYCPEAGVEVQCRTVIWWAPEGL